MYNEIIISRDNLINNIKQVKSNNPKSKICIMVKANAYGVGMHEVVSVIDEYVDCYGVACFFEAETLRTITNKDILMVGALENLEECARLNIQVSIHSLTDAKRIKNLNKHIKVHIKINSGMNRYGVKSKRELNAIYRILKGSETEIVGLYTHFATDDDYVDTQMREFLDITKDKEQYKHVDNSIVSEIKNHSLDMVRIGYNIYNQDNFGYKSVVTIKSRIVQINNVKEGELVGYARRFVADKRTKVAIIPIGYADGFDMRYLGSSITYNEVECRILNICMDCFMLDISATKAKVGDEIYILDSNNPLKKYADTLGSSEYEVMTKFGTMRAERIID